MIPNTAIIQTRYCFLILLSYQKTVRKQSKKPPEGSFILLVMNNFIKCSNDSWTSDIGEFEDNKETIKATDLVTFIQRYRRTIRTVPTRTDGFGLRQ